MFFSLTKYNDGGSNNLTLLQINDDDINDCESGRMDAHKKSKTAKDDTRYICTGSEQSPFPVKGLSVKARIQVIEVAQFEARKVREDFKQKILQLSNKSDILLRERSQQIDMAKKICPIYNADEEVWKEVIVITTINNEVKKEIEEVKQSQIITSDDINTTSNLASQFLKSLVHSPVKTKKIQNLKLKHRIKIVVLNKKITDHI